MTLLDTALAYHRAGLVVLPNDPAQKFPAGLKGWQHAQPTEQDMRRWFQGGEHAIGVRDVEGLDIDNKGSPNAETLYRELAALTEQLAPGLIGRLLCERTPSGGYHLVWRCEAIAGNQKLATRPPTNDELRAQPKTTAITLIETRGRGGQFQVAPSPGYTLIRGDWCSLPEISPNERLILLGAAKALSRADKRIIDTLGKPSGERAGDRFNQEGASEALSLLLGNGWSEIFEREGAKYLCRPGKDHGVSATFGYVAPGVLYVFTTNAAPFQDGKAYGPFAIYAELEHDGDYKAAAKTLYGRYEAQSTRTVIDVATGELIAVPSTSVKSADLVRAPSSGIDFYDLIDTPRLPIRWYAPGFVREGLGIMAGEANIGKTPMLAQLALAFACGGLWMNKVQCRQSKTLFIGTEYTRDELGYVIEKSAAGVRPPKGMLAFKSLNPNDPEADREIQPETPAEAFALLDYFYRVERYEVIIIDVFTGFLPHEPFKQSVYRGDYKEFKPYHLLALRYHGALLGSWHSVKREANPRYMYNGSSGLWAVPASRVTLYTDQENRVRIFSMPRFEKKLDWALSQEQTMAGLRWVVADAAPEPMCSPTELQIYRCLRDHAEKARPLGPTTIAELTNIPIGTVKSSLSRMFGRNMIQQPRGSTGYYIEHATNATNDTFATDATLATTSQHERVANATQMQPSDIASGSGELAGLQELHGFTVAREDAMVASSIFDSVPPGKRTVLRVYLRSKQEKDQERASELCAEYGIDYDAARAAVAQAG